MTLMTPEDTRGAESQNHQKRMSSKHRFREFRANPILCLYKNINLPHLLSVESNMYGNSKKMRFALNSLKWY